MDKTDPATAHSSVYNLTSEVNAGRVSRFHLKLMPFISPQSTLPDPAGAFRASVVGPTSALPHLVPAWWGPRRP